jgi:hypothetical protein
VNAGSSSEVLRIKASLLQAAGRAAPDEIENLLIKSLSLHSSRASSSRLRARSAKIVLSFTPAALGE